MHPYEKELERRGWRLIDTTRPGHRFLEADDDCWCIFTNDGQDMLCSWLDALKNNVDIQRKCIAEIGFAKQIDVLLKGLGLEGKAHLVPMPPSVKRGDPKYDDRIESVCKFASAINGNMDTLNLLECAVTTKATHNTDGFRSIERAQYAQAIVVDEKYWDGKVLVVVDDVITSGAHSASAKRYLQAIYNAPVIGVFLARTPTRRERELKGKHARCAPWYVVEDKRPLYQSTSGPLPWVAYGQAG